MDEIRITFVIVIFQLNLLPLVENIRSILLLREIIHLLD